MSKTSKSPSEKVVKDIKRATRKQHERPMNPTSRVVAR